MRNKMIAVSGLNVENNVVVASPYLTSETRVREEGKKNSLDVSALQEGSAETEADENDGLTAEEFDKLLDDFLRSEYQRLEEEEEKRQDEADDDSEEMPPSDNVQENENQEDALSADEPLLKSMDFLVGLDGVKTKLSEYEKVVRFNRMRYDQGLPIMSAPLHAMFLGSPGTGKTTVAKMMGMMLRRAGMLSKGHVVVKERADLIGIHYGEEERNTQEALNEAEGGVLLIDEAYQLYQPHDPKDPGRFVIESLLTALADESRRNWMLILAGYPDEMRRMFEMNPGLASRFPESNIYVFEDLDEGELMQVAERYFAEYEYELSSEARELLARRIASDYAARNRSFGNARYVHNLIQTAILPAMAARVVDSGISDRSSLTTVLPADIPAPLPIIPRGRRPVGFVA